MERPTDDVEFEGHGEQLMAAILVENVLTPQGVHVPIPVAFLYVPASQGEHATPSTAAVYPALQLHIELPPVEKVLAGHPRQVLTDVAVSALEYVFALHEVHAVDPLLDFHLPPPQGVQTVMPAPVYPARQVQIRLPADENELLGHGEHVLASTAASSVEKDFTPHDMQAAEPVADFHVPTPHAVHSVPSGPV